MTGGIELLRLPSSRIGTVVLVRQKGTDAQRWNEEGAAKVLRIS